MSNLFDTYGNHGPSSERRKSRKYEDKFIPPPPACTHVWEEQWDSVKGNGFHQAPHEVRHGMYRYWYSVHDSVEIFRGHRCGKCRVWAEV